MSERTMETQRAQDLANRRETATFRLANTAAYAASMLTDEMHEPGRLSVRRDLWDALDEWREAHGLPDGWPIAEALTTPELGGEGEVTADEIGAIEDGIRRLDERRRMDAIMRQEPRLSTAELKWVVDTMRELLERLRTPRGEGEASGKGARDVGYMLGMLHAAEHVFGHGKGIIAAELVSEIMDGFGVRRVKELACEQDVSICWKEVDVFRAARRGEGGGK